jgi:hypothetical protein
MHWQCSSLLFLAAYREAVSPYLIILRFCMFYVEYAQSVKYTEVQRPVIDEDVVKAIKFKLNNEEQAFKKQHEEQPQ